MAVKKTGLGRGLDMLLSSAREASMAAITPETSINHLKHLPIEHIKPGPFQPRHHIDTHKLQELACSIKAQGLVQPVVVRKVGSYEYELIVGERRWRAAQLAGLHDIPVIIREVPDNAAAAIALIENIQREDLNALEEAMALHRLIIDFGLTHQQTADAIGRSRAAVSNLLRLLELEAETKVLVDEGKLEMGHARALLALSGRKQVDTAHRIVHYQLSVRETEQLVRQMLEGAAKPAPHLKNAPDVAKLEQKLAETLGAKVMIRYNQIGKGKLVIEYNTLDELEGILGHIQ